MKNLAELQAECAALGIKVDTKGRASKEPYIAALRDYHWREDHPDDPLPAQVMPMLLGSWEDLDEAEAAEIEADGSGWLVQQKMDGVRALLHIENDRVRITSRMVSEVTYRLSEFQANLPHLSNSVEELVGTVLDGELVCPMASVDTRDSRTENALQAAVAILATSPEKASKVQTDQNAHLQYHAFDILKYRGCDSALNPLIDRLDVLRQAVCKMRNPHILEIPTHVIGKSGIHQRLLALGAEGSVWKRLDGGYESGQRVRHWLKRKRGLSVEAFVTGFKPGTADRGNGHLVGAVEFSHRGSNGTVSPIAWVSGWTHQERLAMTTVDSSGRVGLSPAFMGKKAVVVGQDLSARSRRLQHARLQCWIEA